MSPGSWGVQYPKMHEVQQGTCLQQVRGGDQHCWDHTQSTEMRYFSCKEKVRCEDYLTWRREGLGEISPMYINTSRKSLRKMQSSFFKWCPMTEQEVPGTNWNKAVSVWPSRNTFLLWEWLRTEADCSGISILEVDDPAWEGMVRWDDPHITE